VTDLVFSLTGFSIKLSKWEHEVSVDFSDTNCVILTGLNAGGKTLTMRSLEKFCDAIANPDRRKMEELQRLALDAGIESMETRFEYVNLDNTKTSFFDVDGTVPWIKLASTDSGYPDADTSKIAERLGLVEDAVTSNLDVRLVSSVILDHRFDSSFESEPLIDNNDHLLTYPRLSNSPHIGISRREGIKLDAKIHLFDDRDGYIDTQNFVEEIMGRWERPILPEDWPMERRFASFGPFHSEYAWMKEVEERTGIRFDTVHAEQAADYHQFWEPGEMLRFSVNTPVMQDISKAYRISDAGIAHYKRMLESYNPEDGPFPEVISEAFKSEVKSEIRRNQDLKRLLPLFTSNATDDERKMISLGIENMDEESKMRLMESIGKDLGFVDDEYQLDSEEHFVQLFSVVTVQMRVLGFESAKHMDLHKPERYHLYDWNNPETTPLPRDWSNSEGTIKLAILGNPDFSVFVALKEMLGISEVPEHPSSGQSRILSIFEDLSLQEDGSTIMIDEPELSLHIDLQEIMVTRLSKLFPHLQFIFSTHSPNVIMGHTEKVVEVPPREEV